MRIVPLTMRDANEFIAANHRHHKPVRGCKFCIGAEDDSGKIVGVCVVGRPVNRHLDDGMTVEVTRLATDGTDNACSFLYGAAARVAKHMGYTRIYTYTMEDEPGTSLLASGWQHDGLTQGGNYWGVSRSRSGTEHNSGKKQRWYRRL